MRCYFASQKNIESCEECYGNLACDIAKPPLGDSFLGKLPHPLELEKK